MKTNNQLYQKVLDAEKVVEKAWEAISDTDEESIRTALITYFEAKDALERAVKLYELVKEDESNSTTHE